MGFEGEKEKEEQQNKERRLGHQSLQRRMRVDGGERSHPPKMALSRCIRSKMAVSRRARIRRRWRYLGALAFAKDGRTDADEGGSFFDGDGEVVAHAH